MVGLVIVTHSPALAEGVVETCRMMAKDVSIMAAGGMENGAFGTSYARIVHAIDTVYGADGVVILMDAGSAILTVETIVEERKDELLRMADCPVVEGSVVAAVAAVCGAPLDEVVRRAEETRRVAKIDD
ncbi:dihydroxyacetone kinase phosphoryl donor subunit DhaM [Selenomonas sp. F0473]|uniref:dihydroxyacetone kinase phosphoryl donor subunit DhaM n=1 Tax=Selenomonas sp. F0473 TaxID=999423 RepID=UPI00029E2497|nr:dihydroxyacetone kinase phosphoryl donor subunit DhaM [Selenomonas sp. F0473]EKU70567.1 dihydroxyacetone kinase, phosphotransfer subunit [Selenomonas sp. F0473]